MMSLKKILLLSALLTLVTSLIPIQRSLRDSFECGYQEEAECFSDYTTYGFPFVIAKPYIWNSPAFTIDWNNPWVIFGALISSIPNWGLYTIILLPIISIIQNKRPVT
ncbi:MAG: hypothetical protein KBD15_01635 [Candidatus Magasanikbacteria bacterium]|jgi:hypothetical protein|nr:hypothetical protein [Candidatus Magasanikbacteria bacterium]